MTRVDPKSEATLFERSLEDYIDKHSVLDLLVLIECLCDEKAEHIASNWQDEALSRAWENAARAVGRAARADAVNLLP